MDLVVGLGDMIHVIMQSNYFRKRTAQCNHWRTVKSNYQNHLVNLLVIHGEYTSWRSPHQIETHQTYILQATILHLTADISKPAQNIMLRMYVWKDK